MPSFEVPVYIDFELSLICHNCVQKLEYGVTIKAPGQYVYSILPCTCQKELITDARELGFGAGHTEGHKAGYYSGLKEGIEEGLKEGHEREFGVHK